MPEATRSERTDDARTTSQRMERKEGQRPRHRIDLRDVVARKIAERNAGMSSSPEWLARLKRSGPMLQLLKPAARSATANNVCTVCTTIVPVKSKHVAAPVPGLAYVYAQRNVGRDCGRETCIYSEKFNGAVGRPAAQPPAEPVPFVLPEGWTMGEAPLGDAELVQWKAGDPVEFVVPHCRRPSAPPQPALSLRDPANQIRLRGAISAACMKEYDVRKERFVALCKRGPLHVTLPERKRGQWEDTCPRPRSRSTCGSAKSSVRKHRPPPLRIDTLSCLSVRSFDDVDMDAGWETDTESDDEYEFVIVDDDCADPSVDEFGVMLC